MRIRIMTSGTTEQAGRPARPLSRADFRAGGYPLQLRAYALRRYRQPAARLYLGRQHVALLRAVEEIRRRGGGEGAVDVEVSILSAGYGLVPEDEPLVPYRCTFAEAGRRAERAAWAEHLGIPQAVRRWARRPADAALVVMGSDPLEAAGLGADHVFGAPTLILSGGPACRRLPVWPGVRAVCLARQHAARFGVDVAGLRGLMASRVLHRLAEDPGVLGALMDPDVDVLDALDPASAQLRLF